jgi:hydroxymethylpyrimidine/phosphomethylpyrimidine kinase
MRTALTIAGSDSGGGAGIQADLKTFAAFGVYGTSAITAVTAQNTTGVTAWEPVSTELVIAQIEAIAADLPPAAVKTGMLATAAIVEAVAATIAELDLPNLVVDPVMIAKHGGRLLEDDAIAAIVAELLPRAEVVTPNIPEAEVLVGTSIRTVSEMHEAARLIRKLGPRVVVLKGGHLPRSSGSDPDFCVDVFSSAHAGFELRGPRLDTPHTHGTGCTFAAAIAAALALGQRIDLAVSGARDYVEGAIRNAPALGRGHGPLNHFWRLY